MCISVLRGFYTVRIARLNVEKSAAYTRWVYELLGGGINMREIIIETERLILRKYTRDDVDGLLEILSDPETMRHYPSVYDRAGAERWLDWCFESYQRSGFGLWAIELKKSGEFIGDTGLTMQNIDDDVLPEIGYHINKKYWRRGFAKEAASAVRDWAFSNTDLDAVYSYMKYSNSPSYHTAQSIGMIKVGEYPSPEDVVCYVYRITREEWQTLTGKQ